MPDYKQGQIYRLWSPHTDKFYIGSTCNMLAKRLWLHKNDYSGYLNQTRKYISSFELFKLGIDDVKIELIELCPCNSKTELVRREGILQREHKDNIVNFMIAGRTNKEWYEDNKEIMKEKRKIYEKKKLESNPDLIYEKTNEYRKNNADKINERQRKRYENNKQNILEQNKIYAKKYFESNPDLIHQKQKEYRDKTKAQRSEYMKKWYAAKKNQPLSNASVSLE